MGQHKSGKGSPTRLISYVRWWVLVPCVLMVAGGVVALFLRGPEGTRYFVAGTLIGIGAGAGLSEVTAVSERRNSDRNARELRSAVTARRRLAYRMGEFFFGFYAALSKGKPQDREVTEFLFMGEMLGIRASLDALVSGAKASDPDLHRHLLERVQTALTLSEKDLSAFFQIGQDILAVRGADAKENADARKLVASRIASELNDIKEASDDTRIGEAWANINRLWDEGKLEPAEIDNLLLAVHLFFLTMGLEELSYATWKSILNQLGKMKTSDARPPALTSVLASISAAVA
jgi:hypothetical protein